MYRGCYEIKVYHVLYHFDFVCKNSKCIDNKRQSLMFVVVNVNQLSLRKRGEAGLKSIQE